MTDHALAAPPAETSAALASLPGIRHAFFGRRGGVSGGIYASLNTGPGSADAAEDVVENRRRCAAALGAAADHLLSAHQVHSAEALVVEGPWRDDRRRGDALVTNRPGLAVSALAADCAPVLFADPVARVVAAAHAGWRGALEGIVEATVGAMEGLGARRERIAAGVGPCISQASYEVGPEFVDRFVEADAANARFFAAGAGDRRHFDLKAYVADRVRGAGVGAIEVSPACTCAEPGLYFSHRRAVKLGEPDYGRNLSAICLESDLLR